MAKNYIFLSGYSNFGQPGRGEGKKAKTWQIYNRHSTIIYIIIIIMTREPSPSPADSDEKSLSKADQQSRSFNNLIIIIPNNFSSKADYQSRSLWLPTSLSSWLSSLIRNAPPPPPGYKDLKSGRVVQWMWRASLEDEGPE